MRHGVKPDGSGALMPSEDFFKMSDAELSDIVAYVRSVPPVDAAVPRPSLGPVGKVLLAVGKLPIVVSGTRAMQPIERKALWTYLRSVPAAATNR